MMALLCSTTAVAFDLDYGQVFPTVIQGHTDNLAASCASNHGSTIDLTNQSMIYGGTSPALRICKISQTSQGNCADVLGNRKTCTATSEQIETLSLPDFKQSSVGTWTYFSNSSGTISVGAQSADLGNLVVQPNVSLQFATPRHEYRVSSLNMSGPNSVLRLEEGDYWFNILELNGTSVELNHDGITRIFVNNTVKLQNGVKFGSNGRGRLVIISYNDFESDGGQHHAYLYARDRVVLKNRATLTGRITAHTIKVQDSTVSDGLLPIAQALQCFEDPLDGSLNGDNWVVAKSRGDFTPQIVGNRLQLTSSAQNLATSATYQRYFGGKDNLIVLEFDHFAHGGSGADGIGVIFSDATVTPRPGAAGGPLGYGYKSASEPGFAGGWVGVGIDEYGNFSQEGGSGAKPGRRQQSVALRGSGSGASGYRYLAGTCKNGTENTSRACLNPAVDKNGSASPPHRYRITLDSRVANKTEVSVERNTGSGYVALFTPLDIEAQSDQSPIPADFFLSLTGSTGGSTNRHEIDNLKVCAINSRPVGRQIDHFRFEHDGGGLTCSPETLTIRACANAACNTLITEPVTATLAPANGVWFSSDPAVQVSGNQVTFSGGQATLQLRQNSPASIKLDVSGSQPATRPLSTTLCKAGNSGYTAANCTLTFADSGFVFDIQDGLANQPQTVQLRAVRRDQVTQQCVPGFANVTKTINFWGNYNDPSSNPANTRLTINQRELALTNNQAPGLQLALPFDEQGETSLTINYPDAGQVRLNASYTGATASTEAGLTMNGNDLFVMRPVGLCITPVTGVCQAGDASCSVVGKTGSQIGLQISGKAWESLGDRDYCSGNLSTPNFKQDNIALSSEVVAPLPPPRGNGANGAVGVTRYDHRPSASGVHNLNQSVDEVGVFRFRATPPVNGYFNQTIPSAASAPVGRFVPDHFALLSHTMMAACQANHFTYLGQPFPLAFELQARNQHDVVTANYHSEFAKGRAWLTVSDGAGLTSFAARIRPSSEWSLDMPSLSFQGPATFAKLASMQPEEPHRGLWFNLHVDDGDGQRTLAKGANVDQNHGYGCSQADSQCNGWQLNQSARAVDFYSGRLLAGTESGLVTAPLAVALQMQYYSGGNWQLNSEDMCTRLSLANDGVAFTLPQQFDEASQSLALDGQQTIELSLTGSGPAGGLVEARADRGTILFHFAAPGQPVRIPYQIMLGNQPAQPSAPLWLQWLSLGENKSAELQGWAIFGVRRGNDRIIYRRVVQ